MAQKVFPDITVHMEMSQFRQYFINVLHKCGLVNKCIIAPTFIHWGMIPKNTGHDAMLCVHGADMQSEPKGLHRVMLRK